MGSLDWAFLEPWLPRSRPEALLRFSACARVSARAI